MTTTSLSTIGLADRPLPDLLAGLAGLEVDQVAISARQLDRHGWDAAAAALSDGPVRIGAIGSGLTTAASDPGDRRGRDELRLLERSVDLASRLGVPLVTATTGPAGRLCWEDALEAFADRIAPVVARARDLGVALTVENTHSLRSDVSFLHTLRDTVAAARRLDVGVCADLYCCWAEPRLATTVADGLDVIRIVQYGDFVHGTLTQPNRWVPGDGDLPLDRLLDEILRSGYTGIHEIEILGPRISEEGAQAAHARALAWLDARLRRR